MKILVINQAHPPFPGKNGCSVQIYSILKSFKNAGFDISLITINSDIKNVQDSIEICRNDLKINNYKFLSTDDIALINNQKVQSFYNSHLYIEYIDGEIKQFQPDHVFCYTLESALAFDDNKHNLPHSISIVDLEYWVKLYKIKLKDKTSLRQWLHYQKAIIQSKKLNNILLNRLKSATIIFEHAAHHAKWLRSKGINNVLYFPVNYYSETIQDAKEKQFSQSRKLRISLIGGVNGIATIYGLFYLGKNILPLIMKDKFIKENIVINIYGGGKLDLRLQNIFEKYEGLINFHGFVDNLEKVYDSTDLLLVPTNIKLGFRTRIVESFYHRTPVLAHKANTIAMPEFQHLLNGFEAKKPKDFIKVIRKILEDKKILTDISNKAFEDYNNKLSGEVIGRKMVDVIMKIHGII